MSLVHKGDTGPRGFTLRDAEHDIPSDVGITVIPEGYYCSFCDLKGKHVFDKTGMIKHLNKHKDKGDKVPGFIYEVIKERD